jgi:DNA-binding beta-propeller fold protein YncE
VLPFTGLNNGSFGVAVDVAGNVYITDDENDRVLKLAAGSSTQALLPFTNAIRVFEGPNHVCEIPSGAKDFGLI